MSEMQCRWEICCIWTVCCAFVAFTPNTAVPVLVLAVLLQFPLMLGDRQGTAAAVWTLAKGADW